MEVSEFTVHAGRLPTHFYRAGRGESIIFLHGSGPGVTAWANWRYTLPVLADQYDCIAPELWGFARSGHPDPPPVGARAWLEMWVEQIIGLMNYLGIDRAHLVGNSRGGIVALHLIHRYGERFKKVVLMGTGAAPYRITPQLEAAWGFYDNPTAERLAEIMRWFVYDPTTVGGDLEIIARDRLQAALDPKIRRSYEAMFPPPRQRNVDDVVLPEETYKRIEHPILLVHGRDDIVVPLETSLWLLQRLPHAQLHVFSQCGHWVQIEKRQQFVALIRSFLEGDI